MTGPVFAALSMLMRRSDVDAKRKRQMLRLGAGQNPGFGCSSVSTEMVHAKFEQSHGSASHCNCHCACVCVLRIISRSTVSLGCDFPNTTAYTNTKT